MRVLRRRRGLDGKSTHASGATHVIKIGFSTPGNKGGKQPHKLAGFLIYHDAIGPDNKPVIDYEGMSRLGVEKAAIEEAMAKELKAPDGLLPTELHVRIKNDAHRNDDGDWEYPGVFAESLECFGKVGVFCSGNGHLAMRRHGDGTKKEVRCVPEGADATKPKDWCLYSVGQGHDGMKCKSHSRLTVCVFVVGPDGLPDPLAPLLGVSARYRLDTHSDYNAIRIQQELDGAADQLNGRIGGLTGILKFHRQSKRTPEGSAVASAVVGQVSLHLSPVDIAWKLAQINNWPLDGVGRNVTPLLAGPEPDDTVDLEDAEDAIVDTAHEILGEPEQEPAASDPNDSPAMATPEQLRIIDEWLDVINQDREEGKIDINKVMEKKGLASTAEMTVVEAEKTITWLKCKVEEGQGSC